MAREHSAVSTTETMVTRTLQLSEMVQLQSALRLLLAQYAGERAEPWRRSVLRMLRIRQGKTSQAYADQMGPELVASYVSRFADLDRSRVAVRDAGLEAWSLSQLWQPEEWERSVYRRSFAVPNQLHDTVGVTLHLTDPKAEVCLVFHRVRPGPRAGVEHRRALLEVLLEPLRAGLAITLGAADPAVNLSSLIEVTGQALVLYDLEGRELRQNPVMQRILAREPEHDSLQEHIRAVVRSVLGCISKGREPRDRAQRHNDGTRREVATSQAAYRLRGNLVGRNHLGHGTAVLVSVDRVAYQVPAPDSMRARYGLTVRELQVASLLMHRLSNAEIARMLGISPHTARHHTESVLAKFGVRSREALRRAVTEATTA
jgi:DNA-binding CsgD family transcriptional regulator